MATVADLAQLENLVERLTPLSQKRRGELIEAHDWNTLAGALLELARVSLTDDEAAGVPVHEHPDQVDIGWLSARLRSLITQGGLRDPAGEAALGKIERQLVRLAERLESLTQRLDRLQGDIKSVETRDITREADLTRFSRRLDGAFDARDDVAGLRASLRSLESDVSTAVELSRRVQDPGGQPIDFSDLAVRISGLEELRASLTTPAGEVLSAAEYERRLAELRSSLVTEAELDAALGDLRSGVETDLRASVLEESRVVARSTIDDDIEDLRSQLSARIDERLASLDDAIDARITPATSDLREALLGEVRAERSTALAGAVEALRGELTRERDTQIDALNERFQADIAGLRGSLAEELQQVVDARVEGLAGTLEQRIARSEQGLAQVRDTVEENRAAIRENATGLATARRDFTAADSQLRAETTRRFNELEAGIDTRVDGRVTALRDDLQSSLRDDIQGMVGSLETRLNESIRRSVATEVTLAANRLRNDVNGIVATELEGMRSEIDETIARRVEAVNTRINGEVASEVRRSLANLDERIRREVEALRPEIERPVVPNRPVGPG